MSAPQMYLVDLGGDADGDPSKWLHPVRPDAPVLRATDRGFQRGDGIFEALSVVDGRPQALRFHLERFRRSAAALRLPLPDLRLWEAAVRAAIAASPGAGERYVKFMLSRGHESIDHPATVDPELPPTAVLYIADAASYDEARRRGVTATLLETGRDSGAARRAPWLLIGAKTLSYAQNVSAQLEAKARGVDEAILTTSDGFLLEGPSATLVLLRDGAFVTPDPAIGILPGTSQQSLFDELAKLGRHTEVRDVAVDELFTADGAWLVSSVRMAVAVTAVDGASLATDDETTRLINELLLARCE